MVHSGSDFSQTTLIDKKVKESIKNLFELAPLHNPANLKAIEVAHKYAIPNKFLNEHKIRVNEFHGTSHKYVSKKAIEYMDQKIKNYNHSIREWVQHDCR